MGLLMLRQTFKKFKNIFSNIFLLLCESWRGKKIVLVKDQDELRDLIGLIGSKSLTINDKTQKYEVDAVKLGALFTSSDIANDNGKFVISTENDDEKTEFYDIVCNINVTIENNMLKLTKLFRRVTIYRNSKGRLVNVVISYAKTAFENVPLSLNTTTNNN